jgi:hypothetical protein
VNIYLVQILNEVIKCISQMVVNVCKIIFFSGTCQLMLINIESSYWLM